MKHDRQMVGKKRNEDKLTSLRSINRGQKWYMKRGCY